jgi:8-oxo-dGTP pyrophosphatase MutT (NUDIX family)
VRFEWPDWKLWVLPGGGIEPGETPEHAIARELIEEVGVRVPAGPAIWTRDHWFLGMEGWAGQRERIYLVRLPSRGGAIVPAMSPAELADEHVTDHRWWSLAELEAATGVVLSPWRLPALLRELIDRGPPPAPVDVGD